MKATITHVINGTTHMFEVTGEHIQTQLFPGGISLIVIRDRPGGSRHRAIHVAHTELVDVEF